MKIMILSDIHLHEYRSHARIDEHGNNSRMMEIVAALEMAKAYADDNDIEVTVFCGDLFQNRESIPTAAAVAVNNVLFCWPGYLIGVAGNHDKLRRDVNTLAAVWQYPGHIICEHSMMQSVAGVKVHAVEYSADADVTLAGLKSVLDDIDDNDKYNILIMHDTIHGVRQSTSDKAPLTKSKITLDALPTDAMDLIAVGHIHISQALNSSGPGCPVLIPGSLTQLNFGDAGDFRGFHVFDTETGLIEMHPTKTAQFAVIAEDTIHGKLAGIKDHHVRVVFPPDTRKEKAKSVCRDLEHNGVATADYRILPQPEVMEIVARSDQNSMNPRRMIDEYLEIAERDVGMDKLIRSIGYNVIGEVQDGA